MGRGYSKLRHFINILILLYSYISHCYYHIALFGEKLKMLKISVVEICHRVHRPFAGKSQDFIHTKGTTSSSPPKKYLATFVFTFKNHLHLYKEKYLVNNCLRVSFMLFSSMYNFLK